MQNNTLKKLKHGEIIKPVFKYIIDNVATQPTKHRQTNTTPTILFETEYLPFEKKTVPVRFDHQNFSVPSV